MFRVGGKSIPRSHLLSVCNTWETGFVNSPWEAPAGEIVRPVCLFRMGILYSLFYHIKLKFTLEAGDSWPRNYESTVYGFLKLETLPLESWTLFRVWKVFYIPHFARWKEVREFSLNLQESGSSVSEWLRSFELEQTENFEGWLLPLLSNSINSDFHL